MRRRLTLLIALLACGVALGAVASPGGAGSAKRVVCRPPSLKDCYGYSTMIDYANVIIPMIERFFALEYERMPAPRAYVYVAGGQVRRIGCIDESGSHVVDSRAYEFCPLDRKIYLGQDSLWLLYHAAGDAAPAVGLAHEWGHNVQNAVGVSSPDTNREQVRYENQADCVSGAWLRFADRRGWLESEDVGSIQRYVRLIASAESESRDHGDLAQRAGALRRGMARGLASCNAYFPRTPLITG